MAVEKGLPENIIKFIKEQKIFFVATAPLDVKGNFPNLSPKGRDSLHVIDNKTLMYVDYHGSGNSTALHLSETGRVTLMFMSVDGKPMILRVYCAGAALSLDSRDGKALVEKLGLKLEPYARQLIVMSVESFKTTCGLFVPYFQYLGERNMALSMLRRPSSALGDIVRFIRVKIKG